MVNSNKLGLTFALFVSTEALGAGESQNKNAIKLSVLCGTTLTVEYDTASLKKNNKDIGYGQTAGSNQCDEPLRYMWYACQTTSGKSAVKKLGVSKVQCRGVTGKVGKLSKSANAIIVDRAFEEPNYFVRSHKQFQTILGSALKIKEADPYNDSGWQDFSRQEIPVLDTKSYCLVDGEKKSFEKYSSIYSAHEHQKRNGVVKCWENGEQVMDLTFVAGKKTGYRNVFRNESRSLATYKNDQHHGDQKTFEKEVLTSHSLYQNGQEIWIKEYSDGNLKSYQLKTSSGYAGVGFGETGKITNIDCTPATKNDSLLSKLCGFGRDSTVKVYDTEDKVKNTYVFKDGVMESRKAGDSDFAAGSDVEFSGGKKHGTEKIIGKYGKLAALIHWKNGVKDGAEKIIHTDGEKVVKLVIWKNGKIEEETEFYLNGNPKTKETFITGTKKKIQSFYDSGKLMDQGVLTSCPSRYRGWCKEGVFRRYSEKTKLISEQTFRNGSRSGTSKVWFENGKIAAVEEYVDDILKSSRYYELNGSLREAAEYEDDGSKKVKKK